MSEVPPASSPTTSNRTMFNRDVDFSLEETPNAYEACRALSQRARDLNSRFRHAAPIEETTPVTSPNPTVTALTDYSVSRIAIRRGDDEADSPPAP